MSGSGCNPKVTEKNADLQPAVPKKPALSSERQASGVVLFDRGVSGWQGYAIQLVSSFIAPSGVNASDRAEAGISTVSP